MVYKGKNPRVVQKPKVEVLPASFVPVVVTTHHNIDQVLNVQAWHITEMKKHQAVKSPEAERSFLRHQRIVKHLNASLVAFDDGQE